LTLRPANKPPPTSTAEIAAMRALVTGGAGFIGSQTVRELLRRGDVVTVLDDLSTGDRASILDATLVVGSVDDRGAVGEALAQSRPEAVLHFAALKSVEESQVDPGRYFAINVGGTLSVLDAAAAAGVGLFVYSSSCAVYGSPDRTPVDEATPVRPENPYGESKALAERLLPWFESRYGLRFASLRYFNAAGADPSGEFGEDWGSAPNLVPRALRVALGRDRTIDVFGTDYPTSDGTAVRDYIHVVDLALAHLRALDVLASGGESMTLNLGTGRGSSVREVLATIERISGRAVPTREADRRTGDPPAIWADPSAAQRMLGWRARFGLEEIVESAWRWSSRHERVAG
jgi:UDP-glucose-4-epimerase GalE